MKGRKDGQTDSQKENDGFISWRYTCYNIHLSLHWASGPSPRSKLVTLLVDLGHKQPGTHDGKGTHRGPDLLSYTPTPEQATS